MKHAASTDCQTSHARLCSLTVCSCHYSFAEDLDKQAHGGPSGYAKETARCKALDVRRSLRSKAIVPDLIISADTVSTHPPAKAKQTRPELDPSGTSLQF